MEVLIVRHVTENFLDIIDPTIFRVVDFITHQPFPGLFYIIFFEEHPVKTEPNTQ